VQNFLGTVALTRLNQQNGGWVQPEMGQHCLNIWQESALI